jgi:hypothetical protein
MLTAFCVLSITLSGRCNWYAVQCIDKKYVIEQIKLVVIFQVVPNMMVGENVCRKVKVKLPFA